MTCYDLDDETIPQTQATNSFSVMIMVSVNSPNAVFSDINLEPSDIRNANGFFHLGETRLFEIDQFLETTLDLPANNYTLTTDLDSKTSDFKAPGCSSFLTSNVKGYQ